MTIAIHSATRADLTDNHTMSKNISKRNEERLRAYLAAQEKPKPKKTDKKK